MGFMKYAYYLVGIVFFLHTTQFSGSDAYVNVFLVKRDGDNIRLYKEDTFCDLTAAFGPSIPGGDSEHGGLLGHTMYANPHNACLPVDPAPPGNNHTNFIAVISRTGDSCPFERKVYNAQMAGFKAAIVHNVGSEDLVTMESSDIGLEITIPSVFVGYLDGIALGKQYNYHGGHNGYVIRLDNGVCMDLNLKKYLLPFAITVGVCFFLMLTYMCVKWIQDVRKRRRGRLSNRHLKKIPIQKFKKGDKYDTCAICLDEYEDGEKLRVLPCHHGICVHSLYTVLTSKREQCHRLFLAYHVKCVDPWLLNRKRTCPVCKRKVYPGKEQAQESDSSEEDNSPTEDEERQPLLSAQMYIQQERRQMLQSSFDRSGLPGALRSEVSSIPSNSSYGTADTDSLVETSRARPSTASTHSNYSSGSDSNNSTIGVHEPVDVHGTQQNRSTGASNCTDLEEIGAVGGHHTANSPVDVKVVSKSDDINELLAKTI